MERNTPDISLGIGIPTLNRYDILYPNLMLYSRDFELYNNKCKLFIVDNGNQSISFEAAEIYVPEKNLGVAASWNYLCDRIFETCDYALILNDDIYLGKPLNKILSLIEKKPNFLRATPDWCAFIIPKKVFQKVGRFDEIFYPAYYEDKSYEYRMKLKNIPIIKTPELNPFIYNSSKTLEKDSSILQASKTNKEKYISMWGGEPEREKFKNPYNKTYK